MSIIPKKTGSKTKAFCIYGLNLVILAWMSDELSCNLVIDTHTYGHTDPQTQPMTMPRRPKLATGKNEVDHDCIIKWKHFPRYWPFVWKIHRSPVNSPHKGQWRWALMFSLICTWTNGWTTRHRWFQMPFRSLWCHSNVRRTMNMGQV